MRCRITGRRPCGPLRAVPVLYITRSLHRHIRDIHIDTANGKQRQTFLLYRMRIFNRRDTENCQWGNRLIRRNSDLKRPAAFIAEEITDAVICPVIVRVCSLGELGLLVCIAAHDFNLILSSTRKSSLRQIKVYTI